MCNLLPRYIREKLYMPSPPPGNRQLPGLSFKDRKAETHKNQKAARLNIMSNNRFNILAGNDGATADDPSMDTAESKVKKPPPIEVYDKKLNEIKSKINKIENLTCASSIRYQFTTIKSEQNVRETVKVYCDNNIDYELVQKSFDLLKIEYSTHPLHDDKKTKICMYGLNDIPIDEIKNEINGILKITPEIKMITPKTGHVGESRIYILYFKKSDRVKAADLRNAITGLYNLRVRFEYYSPRKFGPTQCSNCQDFGHGAEKCHRKPKCVRCGGNHASNSCIHLPVPDLTVATTAKPKIRDELIKCANCGGKHTANYTKCNYRVNVIQKQNRFRGNRKVSIVPEKKRDDFPPLPGAPPIPPAPPIWHLDQQQQQQQQRQYSIESLLQQFMNSQNRMFEMMTSMMTQMSSMITTINVLMTKMSEAINATQ